VLGPANRRRLPGIWVTSHLANPSATELRQTSNGAVPSVPTLTIEP
jgi:hypothetical protein